MIDIVIVNYNSTDWLLKCLRSVHEKKDEWDVRTFIWDNHSGDQPERINTFFPNVFVHFSLKNIGYAAAVNQLVRHCKAPYMMMLNPDTVITGNFFENILQFFRSNLKVGVLGPKIVNLDGTLQESARSFPTVLTGVFGRSSLMSRYFPTNKISMKNLTAWKADDLTAIETDWVSGACMVVRRQAIEEVGLLDERFFMYWEDADWCRRMKAHGWEVVYFPKATVIHHVGKSSETVRWRSLLAFHVSAYRFYLKYVKKPFRIFKPIVWMALAMRCYMKYLFEMMPKKRTQNDL